MFDHLAGALEQNDMILALADLRVDIAMHLQITAWQISIDKTNYTCFT